LLYVLPYQASLNAMHNRLSGSFPGAVALQHGRALQALYRNLLEKGYTRAAAAAAARNAKQLARLHHHPIRVLTPYQLLRGMFRLKGYESLLTDCTQACLVLDEIHAYEPFRLGMILAAMEYLREQWNCRFFVMSATLPSRLRMELEDVLCGPHRIVADVETYRDFARHRLNFLSGTVDCEAILKLALDSSRTGKAVLVVCNTVRKARDVYVRLKQLMPDSNGVIHLLHSRFTARDRLTKEKAISAIVGTRTRSESANGTILVATQVVEVSLDIDFDVVLSEPAPLESLVQRFGRVNRGRRHRLCDVFVLADPLSGQRVYDDAYVVAGYSALRRMADQPIDEAAITQMLDDVYSGMEADRWFGALSRGRREFKAACLNDLRAFQSDQKLEDQFDQMFDGTEVLPASYLDEYRTLFENDPIGASELLIPMPYWQLQLLRKIGRVRTDNTLPWIKIADVPYDRDGGLDVETASKE
jgi:CRISPR-associated endonuclease/helicase Cas3